MYFYYFKLICRSQRHFIWIARMQALSPKAAKRMLMATYICFTICFFTDLIIILASSSSTSQVVNPCYSTNSRFQLYFFNQGTIGYFVPCYNASSSNVYEYQSIAYFIQGPTSTFSLSGTQTDFTGLTNWTTGSNPDLCLPVSLSYDVAMWSCSQPLGCGNKFETIDSKNAVDSSYWHFTYSDTGYNINTNMCNLKNGNSFSWQFIYPSVLNDVSKYLPQITKSIFLYLLNLCLSSTGIYTKFQQDNFVRHPDQILQQSG